MSDFMHKRQVVVGALDRIRIIGSHPDPYIARSRQVVRKVSPSRRFVVHQSIAAEAQITHSAQVIAGEGEIDVGNGAPRPQGSDNRSLLRGRQFIQCVVFILRAVIGGEIRSPRSHEAIAEVSRPERIPVGSEPEFTGDKAVDERVASQ